MIGFAGHALAGDEVDFASKGARPMDFRAALLWDPDRTDTEEERKRAAALAEHFCSAGLTATYAQCAPADLPLLDGLFVGLFVGLFADEAAGPLPSE